jgi:predicted glycosyltransferase
MRILFYLHHPAHFHLFKNPIIALKEKGHEIIILATRKDILEDLLNNENLSYINVLPDGRKDNRLSIALALLKQDVRLLRICLSKKPDILVGTSTEITHIGRILNIPNIFVNEDDIDVIPLVGALAYPFAKHLLLPDICRVGKFSSKKIGYSGYHELAYLHPKIFVPQKDVVSKYFDPDSKYFVLRFAKLNAHHDSGAKGITGIIARDIIKILEPHGNIYITSERNLEPEFEKYRMKIDPLDIHHILSFAQICLGDSQTMMAESGVLGTPFIRFNDFVGRISILAELEDKYNLGFGIRTIDSEKLYSVLKSLISTPDLKKAWKVRREKMLSDKINVSGFLIWLIDQYPESIKTMKINPDSQYNFR